MDSDRGSSAPPPPAAGRSSVQRGSSEAVESDKTAAETEGSELNDTSVNLDGVSGDLGRYSSRSSAGHKKSNSLAAEKQGQKLGHRRVNESGQVSYKKVHTNTLMASIQLGIQHSVGGMANMDDRDLLMQDFTTVVTTVFPKQGGRETPAHLYADFTFKYFAPMAFRYILKHYGIKRDDFLLSLCHESMRELNNPGASGSIFYLSSDDEFILKTVQHKEAEFLQKLLPGYYMNLNQNPHTLLPKFFGMFVYRANQKDIRVTVMNNLLPSNIRMHLKYDLKGSTFKRKANKKERAKSSPTYKDLDFNDQLQEGLLLEKDTYDALVSTLQRDCRVLESFRIMDYSLLIGVHNIDQAIKDRAEGGASPSETNSCLAAAACDAAAAATPNKSNAPVQSKPKLVAHSTAMEAIQAQWEPIDEQEHLPPGGIPARNHKGDRLLLFLGLIDILQSYRVKKLLEHKIKSLVTEGNTISVCAPDVYADRFLKYMANRVFKKVPSPLKHSPSKRSKRESVKKDPNKSAAGTTLLDVESAVTPNQRDTNGQGMASQPLSHRPYAYHGGGGGGGGGKGKVGSSRTYSCGSATDAVSVSDVRLESRALQQDDAAQGTPSHLSTGGASSVGWNTPTPTWPSEGTPSYTESTHSGGGGGDGGCSISGAAAATASTHQDGNTPSRSHGSSFIGAGACGNPQRIAELEEPLEAQKYAGYRETEMTHL